MFARSSIAWPSDEPVWRDFRPSPIARIDIPQERLLTVLDFAVGANYIVTDLELRARFELSSLDGELRRAGLHGWVTLHGAVWRANYSGSDRCCRNPSEELDHLLQIVEGLGEASRDLWDRCISRRFDLGYACFDERFALRSQIKAPLLRRLADVNGDLVVTIYRADEKEQTT